MLIIPKSPPSFLQFLPLYCLVLFATYILFIHLLLVLNITRMYRCGKEFPMVKEKFNFGNSSGHKELDRRVVSETCSYEALPSYMSMQWNEIKRARKPHAPERQEQRLSS